MGNLIAGTHGPVICDFDATCIGPREWDLTPVAVGKLRFDYSEDAYSELIAGYGFDVTTPDGFSTPRHIRELKLVTSVIPIPRSNPPIRTNGATGSRPSKPATRQPSGAPIVSTRFSET